MSEEFGDLVADLARAGLEDIGEDAFNEKFGEFGETMENMGFNKGDFTVEVNPDDGTRIVEYQGQKVEFKDAYENLTDPVNPDLEQGIKDLLGDDAIDKLSPEAKLEFENFAKDYDNKIENLPGNKDIAITRGNVDGINDAVGKAKVPEPQSPQEYTQLMNRLMDQNAELTSMMKQMSEDWKEAVDEKNPSLFTEKWWKKQWEDGNVQEGLKTMAKYGLLIGFMYFMFYELQQARHQYTGCWLKNSKDGLVCKFQDNNTAGYQLTCNSSDIDACSGGLIAGGCAICGNCTTGTDGKQVCYTKDTCVEYDKDGKTCKTTLGNVGSCGTYCSQYCDSTLLAPPAGYDFVCNSDPGLLGALGYLVPKIAKPIIDGITQLGQDLLGPFAKIFKYIWLGFLILIGIIILTFVGKKIYDIVKPKEK